MSWKDLSEKINEASVEKNISEDDIAEYLGLDKKKIERILNGDFSFDDRAHIREYLRRISWILDLDFEELWKEYEDTRDKMLISKDGRSTSNKFETFMATVLILLFALVTVNIVKIRSEPCVFIENHSNEELIVNRIILKKGESFPTCESVKVYGNENGVLVRTFGKKNYLVKIENFEVIIDGNGKKSGSR